ncbi:MAG: ATP synthase F1 subunit epsilon [bacterium]|nr:ATP synthase F1 subunit epsilon [bacterium]
MLQFEITTPERVVYKEKIDSVTIPTRDGEITVLPNHLPLVSILKPGVLVVRKGGEENFMAVSGGFVEIQPESRVIILADTAERAEELTLEAVEAARERAQKLLEEKRGADEVAYGAAAAALERELARLKVARRHRAGGAKRGPIITGGEME